MLSLNYENINCVMSQILKLSCASFSYVNISYVLAEIHYRYFVDKNYQKQPTVSALAFTFTLLHLQHQVFKKVKVPSYISQKL